MYVLKGIRKYSYLYEGTLVVNIASKNVKLEYKI